MNQHDVCVAKAESLKALVRRQPVHGAKYAEAIARLRADPAELLAAIDAMKHGGITPIGRQRLFHEAERFRAAREGRAG